MRERMEARSRLFTVAPGPFDAVSVAGTQPAVNRENHPPRNHLTFPGGEPGRHVTVAAPHTLADLRRQAECAFSGRVSTFS